MIAARLPGGVSHVAECISISMTLQTPTNFYEPLAIAAIKRSPVLAASI